MGLVPGSHPRLRRAGRERRGCLAAAREPAADAEPACRENAARPFVTKGWPSDGILARFPTVAVGASARERALGSHRRRGDADSWLPIYDRRFGSLLCAG